MGGGEGLDMMKKVIYMRGLYNDYLSLSVFFFFSLF